MWLSILRVFLSHFHRALKEFAFVVVFGLMPVWLGTIVNAGIGHDALSYLDGYLLNGEALLLATATIGPLLFTINSASSSVHSGRKAFPMGTWYYIIITVICLISAALFSQRAGQEHDTAVFSPGFLWWTSMVISIASTIIWFAVVGTNAVRESGAAALMRQAEEDYVEEFRKE